MEKFLSDCQFFLHGSTVATNTLLEGKGATVGLLTTAGFRDSLEARRGLRKDPWDHRTPYPPVLVPRYLRQPVCGRIDARGNEVEPVNLDDVRAACKVFRDEGVESIAVCLLNSFVNTAHEDAVADVLREEYLAAMLHLRDQRHDDLACRLGLHPAPQPKPLPATGGGGDPPQVLWTNSSVARSVAPTQHLHALNHDQKVKCT